MAAGVRRLRGAQGLGLEAPVRHRGARRHHDRRPQAHLRRGEAEGDGGAGKGQEGQLITQDMYRVVRGEMGIESVQQLTKASNELSNAVMAVKCPGANGNHTE